MLDKNLKEMPLEELQKLLSVSQNNLDRSRLYKQGAVVITHNKNQLEKIQKAIADKDKDPLSSK